MMKSLYEELSGTYILGKDGMYYPDLIVIDNDQFPIGRWGRIHKKYLEAEHPSLYDQLFLNGTLHRHLVDADNCAMPGTHEMPLAGS